MISCFATLLSFSKLHPHVPLSGRKNKHFYVRANALSHGKARALEARLFIRCSPCFPSEGKESRRMDLRDLGDKAARTTFSHFLSWQLVNCIRRKVCDFQKNHKIKNYRRASSQQKILNGWESHFHFSC